MGLADEVNDALDVDLFQEKDTNVTAPTMAFSEFLINKEQGDWAEEMMRDFTNQQTDFNALEYGRSEDKVAGEPGFKEYYESYHEELAEIGKCPDLLVFPESEPSDALADRIQDIEGVPRAELTDDLSGAVAGLEVRSSAYEVGKHQEYHNSRVREANDEVDRSLAEFRTLANKLLDCELEDGERLLSFVDKVERYAECETKSEAPRFRITSKVRRMAENLEGDEATRFTELAETIRDQKKETFGRDYLSITAKVEDFVVILNWIETHGIPHYYVQVFFDSVYLIPFEHILELLSNPDENSSTFQFERNEKNQMKYTVHVDINEATKIAEEMPFPDTTAKRRTFDDGRVQNYVTFDTPEGAFDEGDTAPGLLESELGT